MGMFDNDQPATQAEAYREMVVNMGQDRPEQCWILTPYDTWERNPAYVGPEEPHPEYAMACEAYARHLEHGERPEDDPIDDLDDPRLYPSEKLGDDGVPF